VDPVIFRLLAALAALLAAPAGASDSSPASPRAHVDPDAMREARGDGPAASAQAIAHYLQARRAEQEGDDRGAAIELLAAVAYDDRSPELRVALSQALARAGRPEQAAAEARRAVELAGGQGLPASRGHVVLAKLAAASRDPESAARELRLAAEAQGPAAAPSRPAAELDPEPWRLLALLRLELGDEPGAWGALEELAARTPEEGVGFREAGRWLLARAQAGRAERYLRRAVAAARADLAAWRLLARAHQLLGRSPEVESDLQAVLELSPGDPEAFHGLGAAALRGGDPARARSWLERYLHAAPDPVEAGAEVAGEWLEAGRSAEALEAARSARADGGPDPRLWLAEGQALRRLGRLPEAARALRQVRAEDGSFPEARAALSDALARQGRPSEALRALEAPLRRWPGDERLVSARAGVLVRAGRPREAALALQEAVSAAPRSAPLRLALVRAQRAAGAPGRAESELRALLEITAGGGRGGGEEAEALAELSALRVEQGDLADAEALARQAVGSAPRSPGALAALGRVLALRGDPDAAAEALEQAVERAGEEALLLDALGDAHRGGGRPAAAAAAWRRALSAAGAEPPREAERLRASLRRKLRRAEPFLDPRGPRR
jgi:predicted Zn-dependent protease